MSSCELPKSQVFFWFHQFRSSKKFANWNSIQFLFRRVFVLCSHASISEATATTTNFVMSQGKVLFLRFFFGKSLSFDEIKEWTKKRTIRQTDERLESEEGKEPEIITKRSKELLSLLVVNQVSHTLVCIATSNTCGFTTDFLSSHSWVFLFFCFLLWVKQMARDVLSLNIARGMVETSGNHSIIHLEPLTQRCRWWALEWLMFSEERNNKTRLKQTLCQHFDRYAIEKTSEKPCISATYNWIKLQIIRRELMATFRCETLGLSSLCLMLWHRWRWCSLSIPSMQWHDLISCLKAEHVGNYNRM